MSRDRCRCGANTMAAHTKRIKAGYPAHVYVGFFWGPRIGGGKR